MIGQYAWHNELFVFLLTNKKLCRYCALTKKVKVFTDHVEFCYTEGIGNRTLCPLILSVIHKQNGFPLCGSPLFIITNPIHYFANDQFLVNCG